MTSAVPDPAPKPSAPDRRERRRLETIERTLDVAERLFAEQGFDETKVAQICAEAGIAYGTFFNHFSGKRDLLRGLTDRSEGRFAARLEALSKAPGSIEAQLRALFLETRDGESVWNEARRDLQGLIWMTAATEGNSERDRRFHGAFRSFLRAGLSRGVVRDDVSIDTMAEIVSSVVASMALNWVHDPTYPLRERGEAAAAFLADALAPRHAAQGHDPTAGDAL